MTTEELNDWFEQTGKIITDLNICLNNANRLLEPKTENEDWARKHGFFHHYYYQLWFIISIQLTKLLSNSRNQKYNFNKLLDRLEKEELDDNILQLIEQNKNKLFVAVFRDRAEMITKIQQYKQEIKSNENIIKKFVTSRDKLYAHRDPDAKPQNLTLKDAERLITLCKEIHNCFRGGIFDIYHEFDRLNDWSIDFIIKRIALTKPNRVKKI